MYKRKPSRPTTIKSITQLKALYLKEQFDKENHVSQDQLNGQCGMDSLYDLGLDTNQQEQALTLYGAMYDPDKTHWKVDMKKMVGAIIITDQQQRPTVWAATKARAHKTPWVTNPNTGNKIAAWLVTSNMLVDIYNSKK